MQLLHRNSTNVLRLEEYTDDVTGLPVTNATVTASLFQQDGTQVAGAQNLPMPYYAVSGNIPAQYRGILAASVALPDETYDVLFTATNPDGVREFADTCIVQDG